MLVGFGDAVAVGFGVLVGFGVGVNVCFGCTIIFTEIESVSEKDTSPKSTVALPLCFILLLPVCKLFL